MAELTRATFQEPRVGRAGLVPPRCHTTDHRGLPVKNTFVHFPAWTANAFGTAQRRGQSEPAGAGRCSCFSVDGDGGAAGGASLRHHGDPLGDGGSRPKLERTLTESTSASASSEDSRWGRSSAGGDTDCADEDLAARACHCEMLVQPPDSKGITGVSWMVDAERLQGSEYKVCSPEFLLAIPGWGWCPFQMLLYAHNSRKVLSFRQARGQGRVELKCTNALPPACGHVSFSIGVGAQPPRGWLAHDFSRMGQRSERRMDFSALADPSTLTVAVELRLSPVALAC